MHTWKIAPHAKVFLRNKIAYAKFHIGDVMKVVPEVVILTRLEVET
jgi:hypothetical protein